MGHYSQTESYKQTQRRERNQARAVHERQLREARIQRMSVAVEQDLRRQAALRRLGSW